jgi:hypothetical protein
MKTMIARATVVVGVLVAASAASAQGYQSYRPASSALIVNYEIALPIGSLNDDFISDTSWRGFSIEYRSMVAPRFSAGVGFTYNRWDQTFSNISIDAGNPGGVFSGPVYRDTDQFAVKALGHYYFIEGPLKPYAGIGLGGSWSYAYAQTADLTRSDNNFDFIAAPELGFMLTFAKGASSVGLNGAFRYNFTTADFLGVSNAQSVVFVAGIFGSY